MFLFTLYQEFHLIMPPALQMKERRLDVTCAIAEIENMTSRGARADLKMIGALSESTQSLCSPVFFHVLILKHI